MQGTSQNKTQNVSSTKLYQLKVRQSLKEFLFRPQSSLFKKIQRKYQNQSLLNQGLNKNLNQSQDFKAFTSQSQGNNFDFFDLYELKKSIGEGAHSTVYECIERNSYLTYAVKLIRGVDAEEIEPIKQHYRILKSLYHESIIKGERLCINQKKGMCYLVMEHSDWPTLGKKIRTKYFDDERQIKAAEVIYKLLEVVSYLQEKKVCHRDIKPDNILYNAKKNEIKLIDFDISKMKKYTNEKLDMWTNTGSLHYRAPETFKGCYNQLIDVWSIGVIAYELLTGKLPFNSEYKKDTIDSIMNKEIDFSDTDLSSSAQELIYKLLQKDPSKRIKAKDALSQILFLKHEISSSSPNPMSSSSSKIDIGSVSTLDKQQSQISQISREEDMSCFLLGPIDPDITPIKRKLTIY